DQASQSLLRHTGKAVTRRREPGEAQVEPRRFHSCGDRLNRGVGSLNLSSSRFYLRLRRLHLGSGGHVVLRRVVEILLANGLLLRQRRVAIHIELGPDLICLNYGELRLGLSELRLCLGHLPVGLRELALPLIEDRLKRTGINLKQQLSLLDEGTFRVILFQKITG